MTEPTTPPRRQREKAGFIIAGIVFLVMILFFVGRGLWHGAELREDQAAGTNMATEHTQPLNAD